MAQAHGTVAELWRYPVKSMGGERIDAADMTGRGLLGDRGYALVDAETGKVGSAKNPRRWPTLLDFRSAFVAQPGDAGPLPPARITFPDGSEATTDQPDVETRLSAAVGRPVRLARSPFVGATVEGYWPDHDWLTTRDVVFEFPPPDGTFFDGSMVHFVTTATLARLHALAPASRFDPRRFRPNLVIETPAEVEGFVENDWAGRTLTIGDVQLLVERPCPRCVMTTVAQHDLPKDPAVLRTAVKENEGNVGMYAKPIRQGTIRRGDQVVLS